MISLRAALQEGATVSVLAGLPGWAAFIIWVLIVIVIIILVALAVHALGGFNWVVKIGHFHLQIGVT